MTSTGWLGFVDRPVFSKRGYTRGILHGLSDIPRWRQKFSARSSSTPPHPKHMLNLMNFMGKMAASQSSLKCHRLCPRLPLPHALQTRRNNLLETSCRKRFVTALPGQRKWRNALPTRRKSSDSHYRVLQERLSVLFLLFCSFFFFSFLIGCYSLYTYIFFFGLALSIALNARTSEERQ